MKTLLKKHMIGLFALVLTVATMSFKMTNRQTYWFKVDAITGAISSSPHTPGPECQESTLSYFCSVAFDSPTPLATNISETTASGGSIPVEGVLYKDDPN